MEMRIPIQSQKMTGIYNQKLTPVINPTTHLEPSANPQGPKGFFYWESKCDEEKTKPGAYGRKSVGYGLLEKAGPIGDDIFK